MLLSICVPSYNRGDRALELVCRLINLYEKYSNDIEIVISNNGSTTNTEGYKKIEEWSRVLNFITYFEFQYNKQFVGNFNQVVRLAKGDFCLLISDEDSICEENFLYYLELLKNNPQIGLVRAGTSMMYNEKILETRYAKAGEEALNAYFLYGNYVSGIIYNRSIITNEVVDRLEKKYINDRGYRDYPHMYVDACTMLYSDIIIDSKTLILEGKAAEDQALNDNGFLPYATYESRTEQFISYLKYIADLKISDLLKTVMVERTINKTVFLVKMVENMYLSNGYDTDEVYESFSEGIFDALGSSNIPVIRDNLPEFMRYFKEIMTQYGKK